MGVELMRAFVNVRADASQFASDIRSAQPGIESAVGGISNSINSALGMIGIGLGTAAIWSSLRESESMAENAISSFQRLSASVDATGGRVGFSAAEIQNWAKGLGKSFGISSSGIMDASNRLLMFDSISGSTFKRTMQAAIDLSAKGMGSVESAAFRIGRALESPLNGMRGLRMMGVVLTANQQQLVKEYVKSGQAMKAQEVILSAIESKTAGVAGEVAQTPVGELNKMRAALNSVRVELGEKLIPIQMWVVETQIKFQQSLMGVIGALTPLGKWLKTVDDAVGGLGLRAIQLTGAFLAYKVVVWGVTQAINLYKDAVIAAKAVGVIGRLLGGSGEAAEAAGEAAGDSFAEGAAENLAGGAAGQLLIDAGKRAAARMAGRGAIKTATGTFMGMGAAAGGMAAVSGTVVGTLQATVESAAAAALVAKGAQIAARDAARFGMKNAAGLATLASQATMVSFGEAARVTAMRVAEVTAANEALVPKLGASATIISTAIVPATLSWKAALAGLVTGPAGWVALGAAIVYATSKWMLWKAVQGYETQIKENEKPSEVSERQKQYRERQTEPHPYRDIIREATLEELASTKESNEEKEKTFAILNRTSSLEQDIASARKKMGNDMYEEARLQEYMTQRTARANAEIGEETRKNNEEASRFAGNWSEVEQKVQEAARALGRAADVGVLRDYKASLERISTATIQKSIDDLTESNNNLRRSLAGVEQGTIDVDKAQRDWLKSQQAAGRQPSGEQIRKHKAELEEENRLKGNVEWKDLGSRIREGVMWPVEKMQEEFAQIKDLTDKELPPEYRIRRLKQMQKELEPKKDWAVTGRVGAADWGRQIQDALLKGNPQKQTVEELKLNNTLNKTINETLIRIENKPVGGLT